MKLNHETPHKLRVLAIDTRYRANDFGAFSDEKEWKTRAGQLDRAAELLSEAAGLIEQAIPSGGET